MSHALAPFTSYTEYDISGAHILLRSGMRVRVLLCIFYLRRNTCVSTARLRLCSARLQHLCPYPLQYITWNVVALFDALHDIYKFICAYKHITGTACALGSRAPLVPWMYLNWICSRHAGGGVDYVQPGASHILMYADHKWLVRRAVSTLDFTSSWR